MMQEDHTGKIRSIPGLHRALIQIAKRMGYKYRRVSGDNGYIYILGDGIQIKGDLEGGLQFIPGDPYIAIGKDQPLIDRACTMAHELGHAIDYKRDPMDKNEFAAYISQSGEYSNSKLYLEREKRAWQYAEETIYWLDCWELVKSRFNNLKKSCIRSYERSAFKYNNQAEC